MSKNNVIDLERRDENEDPLTDRLRAGAQQLIHQAVEAEWPWLYLKGISTGEMNSALEVLVGPQAKGLSASTVSRLKQTWAQDYRNWNERRLDQDRWVYIWADGVYSGLRAEPTKLCARLIIGVNERGEKYCPRPGNNGAGCTKQ